MADRANTGAASAGRSGDERWTTKDVMAFVIFNIIMIAATMVVKVAEDMVLSPQNTFFFGSWAFPLVATPFYLVLADRVRKRGVLGASILLFGLIYTFMGGIYCAPVALVGAVIGEVAMLGCDAYARPWRNAIGSFVYWATFMFYGVVPYLLFRDAYMQQLSSYYAAADVEAMVAQYTELPWICAMLAMAAVGTAVGAMLGTRFLNRHVRKAKIA